MTIDLFRPAMHTEKALANLREVLTPDAEGRIYCGEGRLVAEFEVAFKDLISSPYLPLMVNSGTSALELAVYLAKQSHDCAVPNSDHYVISTPMTCTATNGAIVRNGLRIIWADVDPITGLIDWKSVQRILNEDSRNRRVVAIMAVDWGGRLCDYGGLHAATGGGIPVIRDAAHSLLAESQWPLDVMADYTCWSLQAIKHLTTGDGGMLLTPPDQYDRARLLRWYGLDRLSSADFRCAQNIQEIGWKAQSNDIAAAIGLANIEIAEEVVELQRRNARWLHSALRGLKGVTLPPPDETCSWWLYSILVDDRDTFIAYMGSRGIQCSPVHARNDKHQAFKAVSDGWPLPGVDSFAAREVAIPVGWWLAEQDLHHIADAVVEWALATQNRHRELAESVA
jgi:dTDP-4-amino-4,6-dideoxygalactose transaminase